MPAISSFNAMGWWPHCVVTSYGVEGIGFTTTSINTLSDSMKMWWLLEKIDLSFTITYEIISGTHTSSESVSINVTTSPSTNPVDRQCLALTNNSLYLAGGGGLGEMIPINEDNLFMYSGVWFGDENIPGTYALALYFTSFLVPLYDYSQDEISPIIVSESKDGLGFGWQLSAPFGVTSMSLDSHSIDSISFFSVN